MLFSPFMFHGRMHIVLQHIISLMTGQSSLFGSTIDNPFDLTSFGTLLSAPVPRGVHNPASYGYHALLEQLNSVFWTVAKTPACWCLVRYNFLSVPDTGVCTQDGERALLIATPLEAVGMISGDDGNSVALLSSNLNVVKDGKISSKRWEIFAA